jgi:predicted MFS family arabinose efflux permease
VSGPARSRWGPVAAFAVVSSANQMLWLNFAPITTGTAARLGVSVSSVGLAAEVFPLVYVVLAVPFGRALDRWFAPTLLLGALLTAGGALLRLAGGGFAPILAGQVVVAIGQPAVLNAVTGIASRTLRDSDRPIGIALGSAGTFLGFVEAFVLGLVLGAGHLHLLLALSAAYSVLGLALLAGQLARPSLAAHLRAGPDAGPGRAPAAGGRRQVEALRQVLSDGVVRSVLALVFVGFGVFVALTTWVQTLLSPAGVDARSADALLVVMVVVGIASSVVAPPLIARRHAQPACLGVAALGGLVSCVLLAVTPGVAGGAVALGLFGLVLLPALPVLLELIELRVPAHASTATGLLWLSGNAGGVVVALAVQAVVRHPTLAFALMGAVAVGAAPLALRLRTHLRAPPLITS